MSNYYAYCGSPGQVGVEATAALLRDHSAIWCPPPRLRPWSVSSMPAKGDFLWLCWRAAEGEVLVLGGGRLVSSGTPAFGADVLRCSPTLRDAALGLGYSGPTNMSFLVLEPASVGAPTVVPGLGLSIGLSQLDDKQSGQLGKAAPIEP